MLMDLLLPLILAVDLIQVEILLWVGAGKLEPHQELLAVISLLILIQLMRRVVLEYIIMKGSSGVGDTVAHGLGIVPRMMWIKSDDYAYNWQVYHVSRGNTGNLVLNETDAFSVDNSRWDDTSPTSTVWTMGSGATVNYSGRNFMAYLWADVTGYSCINSYYGNGDADGPMIYTGFKSAWIMIKNSERATSSWFIWDEKREGYNPDNDHLYAND